MRKIVLLVCVVVAVCSASCPGNAGDITPRARQAFAYFEDQWRQGNIKPDDVSKACDTFRTHGIAAIDMISPKQCVKAANKTAAYLHIGMGSYDCRTYLHFIVEDIYPLLREKQALYRCQ